MARSPFIILAAQRTGSNWLQWLLNSHSDIACFGEIFSGPPRVDGYVQAFRAKFGFRPPTLTMLRARFLFWYGLRSHAAVGFRLFPQHTCSLTHLKHVRGLRVICLSRDNLLRGLVSLQIAQATARWMQVDESLDLSARRTEIEVPKLRAHLARVNAKREWLKGQFAHVPQLDLSYEDLCADTQGQCQRVMDFLGVPHEELRSKLTKINPEPLSELVSNYSELCAELSGTPLAWMTEPAEVRNAA